MNSAIGLGNILSFIVSYRKWHSLFWAFFHGMFGWGYLFYYGLFYWGQ